MTVPPAAPSDALLPCPFCGFDTCISHPPSHSGLVLARVQCPSCETIGPEVPTEDAAIAAWNTRAAIVAHAPPREPTEAMVNAGIDAEVAHAGRTSFKMGTAAVVWRAMYDAAPAQEQADGPVACVRREGCSMPPVCARRQFCLSDIDARVRHYQAAATPDVEQMLKFSRKQGAQRRHKLLAKHGNETLSAATPSEATNGPSQEGAGGSAADHRDAERMEWFFGPADKGSWMNEYMRGMREGWTVAQWRAAIDAARAALKDAKP